MTGVAGIRGKARHKRRRDNDAAGLRGYRNYLRSIGLKVVGVFGAATVATAARLQRQDTVKQRKL